jgi:hypothetical protein
MDGQRVDGGTYFVPTGRAPGAPSAKSGDMGSTIFPNGA